MIFQLAKKTDEEFIKIDNRITVMDANLNARFEQYIDSG